MIPVKQAHKLTVFYARWKWRGLRNSVHMLGLLVSLLVAGCAYAADSSPLLHAEVNGGVLEYEVSGEGEPVLLIHGTGVAATFAPLISDQVLEGYQLIRFHRRGFAGSSRAQVPFTIKDHAADAIALLKLLGVEKAHIVGHSFGGMVTLQIALDAPELVQSLVVIEAPIFTADNPPGFARLLTNYEAGDKETAMDAFSQGSYGADWRTLARRVDPNGPEQVMRDVDTVFQTEVQGMINWGFGEAQAGTILQPMMFVTGGNGGYSAALPLLQAWMKRIFDVTVVPGVNHAMLMQDPHAVAQALVPFLRRHPFE